MSKTLRWAALPLLGLGMLSTSLTAQAQKAAPAPAAAPSATPSVPATELSAAQRQQLEALRDKTERQVAPLREQLAARRSELSVLWTAEPPNRAAILQKESEVTALRQKVHQLLVEQRLAHLVLLTPAQRSSWRAQHPGGKMGGMCMGNMHGGVASMHGGMGNMHGGTGNMHGGTGNMHGGTGPAGGKSMGMGDCCDCADCMHCEAGMCASPPGPSAPVAPAAPKPR